MQRDLPQRVRSARLQIRISIDEHMADLYPWLSAMPPTLRGRELVAQARVARALMASAARGSSLVDPGAARLVDGDTAVFHQHAAELGEQAVAQARERLRFDFVTAVPPTA